MSAYIIRRLFLMIPTLFGIMLVSFVVVQFAPGGPIERVLAALSAPIPGPVAAPAAVVTSAAAGGRWWRRRRVR
jgi:microcin C transport system permease protein